MASRPTAPPRSPSPSAEGSGELRGRGFTETSTTGRIATLIGTMLSAVAGRPRTITRQQLQDLTLKPFRVHHAYERRGMKRAPGPRRATLWELGDFIRATAVVGFATEASPRVREAIWLGLGDFIIAAILDEARGRPLDRVPPKERYWFKYWLPARGKRTLVPTKGAPPVAFSGLAVDCTALVHRCTEAWAREHSRPTESNKEARRRRG